VSNSDNGVRPLAQEGDSIFERNLAILVKRGQELKFFMGNASTFTGFVVALDTEWIQVISSVNKEVILVHKRHISSIQPTGRLLSEFPKDRSTVLETKVSNFSAVCSGFLHSTNVVHREEREVRGTHGNELG